MANGSILQEQNPQTFSSMNWGPLSNLGQATPQQQSLGALGQKFGGGDNAPWQQQQNSFPNFMQQLQQLYSSPWWKQMSGNQQPMWGQGDMQQQQPQQQQGDQSGQQQTGSQPGAPPQQDAPNPQKSYPAPSAPSFTSWTLPTGTMMPSLSKPTGYW